MPYSIPAPAPAPAPLPVHSTGRPGHRRSYTTTSFTQERGPGAFAPLGALPRRRSGQPSKKTVFQLSHEDDDDDSRDEPHDVADDDVLHNIPPALKLNPNNSFRLSISTSPDDDDDRSPAPLRAKQSSPRASPTKPTASVPFPRSSPLSPPLASLPPPNMGATPPAQNAPRPNVTRTTSTPILLSNGKPLKSSLKSSSSSPQISFPPQSLVPSSTQPQGHLRARSAPSTPSIDHPVHKNVHFPSNEEGGLATVRIFNRSAKPASLSRPPGEDTETETEGELSTGSNSGFIRGSSAVFPFPRSPLGQDRSVKYEVDPTASSPIPAQNPEPYANVYLESLTYNAALPGVAGSKVLPGLSGTLLVRNIAYEKQVAVRFTLDDWQTTSEVSARHLVSLPTLPSTFLASQQLTYGDIAAQPAPPTIDNPQWDRFSFHIKLEDYAFNLAQRTLYLVVRYTATTAIGPVESWDNNFGCNYKIGFREAAKPYQQQQSDSPTPVPNPRGRVFAVSSPPSFAPATTSKPMTVSTTTQPQHAQMVAQTTLLRLKKLNLRNYAAPAPAPGSTVVPSAVTATCPNTNEPAAAASTSVGGCEAQNQGRRGLVKVDAEVKRTATATAKEDESESESESGSESESEEEEDIKTPTGLRSRTALNCDEDPAGQRSGSPTKAAPRSPPPPPIPLLSFSSSSASSSASSTPSTGGSSPQLDMGMGMGMGMGMHMHMDILRPTAASIDIHRPSVLSPLEMGTSPPFSMLAELGPSLGKRKDAFGRSGSSTASSTTSTPTPTIASTVADVKEKEKDKEQNQQKRKQEGYWPWDGKERSEEEVRKVLEGIREKSTSSPVRRVSPPSGGRTSPVKVGGGGGRSSSPLKQPASVEGRDSGRSSPLKQPATAASVEGRGSPVKDGRVSPVKRDVGEGAMAAGVGVVSPQPRMPDWSRVGSGWNKTSSTSTSTAAVAAAPRASPIYLNASLTNRNAVTTVTSPPPSSTTTATTTTTTTTTNSALGGQSGESYTPPYTPPVNVNVNGSASANHQDSVYQAFVRQWCFAQGPGPSLVPGHGHGHVTRYGHGRHEREGEGVGGGQLVV